MSEELLSPMDAMEQNAPEAPPEPAPTPEQPRDESGKFAPKPQDAPKPDAPAPKGQPSQEAARRREAQERDEWRGKFEALNKRFEDMAALAKGESEAPQPEADPIAQVLQKVDGLSQRFEQQDQTRQAEETHRQVLAYANADEQRFTQQTPDFQQAIQHYIQSRVGELKAFGLNDEQAAQHLTDEATSLLYQCAQEQKSPAETMYAMAKARGYQASTMPRQAPPQNMGGRSFGTGAGAGAGGFTAQQIGLMPQEEYDAFRQTPEGKRAIMALMRAS